MFGYLLYDCSLVRFLKICVGGSALTVSYLICNATKFHCQSFTVPVQAVFTEANGLTMSEGYPLTSLEAKKESILSYRLFKCKHELKEKVFGKVFGKEFNYYLKPYEFITFYKEEEDLSLIRLNTNAAVDFINTLNETKFYKLNSIDIDFTSIEKRVLEVSGIWISDIDKAHLNSAGYYGKDVHRHPDVEEMIDNGNISFMQVKYKHHNFNDELKIGISNKGSIILYNSFRSNTEELEIVLDIYKKLIAL